MYSYIWGEWVFLPQHFWFADLQLFKTDSFVSECMVCAYT